MRFGDICRAIGALLVVLASAIATTESPSYFGPAQPVDAALFGMHIHRAAAGTEWPPVPFVEWRLWDSHVAWPQLEPERGKWNFELLDKYVQIAKDKHVEVLLTLGLTPTWASARPHEASAYGDGNAAEPRHISDWQDYVRIVATRYKGVIHNYELWNEPNLKGTFTGNAQSMLELSRSAYQVLKSVDPTIIVVSPAATAESGLPWLNAFLQRDGCKYADAIGYHFYVTPKAPETTLALIGRVRDSMRQHGCDNKPLWNTETGWSRPKQFTSEEEAAGFLMRTYLLNWLMGVQRCYWYAWDNHNWSTLDLTSSVDNRMTRAGAAYGIIHAWMLGSILQSCEREHTGVWVCQLDRSGSTTRVLWSDTQQQLLTSPASWHATTITDWTGAVKPASAQVTVGPAPILLSSN